MKKITIAIDGFSSCGKSTMAKSLAKEIGYIYVDSGAMYRALSFYCICNELFKGSSLDEKKLIDEIANIKIDFKLNPATGISDTYLNGKNVETEIRTMAVSNKVSLVSAVPCVRHAMVALQQEMGSKKGIVMDGRDIGTIVFPTAELKIFVTATPSIRAQRRLDELHSKGNIEITFDAVLDNLQSRDFIDQNRSEGPLKQAKDAIVLDNSYITIEEQMQWLLDKFNNTVLKLV